MQVIKDSASFTVKTHTRHDLKPSKCLQKEEKGQYPGCEVHSSSSVQQQGGDIHVTIVSRDVQRGEPTLFDTYKGRRGTKRVRGKGLVAEGHKKE